MKRETGERDFEEKPPEEAAMSEASHGREGKPVAPQEEQLLKQELREQLLKRISHIKGPLTRAVGEKIFEGLSDTEIAKQLNTTARSVSALRDQIAKTIKRQPMEIFPYINDKGEDKF